MTPTPFPSPCMIDISPRVPHAGGGDGFILRKGGERVPSSFYSFSPPPPPPPSPPGLRGQPKGGGGAGGGGLSLAEPRQRNLLAGQPMSDSSSLDSYFGPRSGEAPLGMVVGGSLSGGLPGSLKPH